MPMKLKVRLPPYRYPRHAWRRAIAKAVRQRMAGTAVEYLGTDQLEVDVCLYLGQSHLAMMDLDNRLKDVLDALQGRFGGPKKEKAKSPAIRNDSQVWRAMVEKKGAPKQALNSGGWVIVRRHKP
jgi:Holliday junction resolvase RusA-like endonuclease